MGLSEFQKKVATLGVKMEAVCFGEVERWGKPMDEWRITLSTSSRPQHSFTFPYFMGVGHRSRSKLKAFNGKPLPPKLEDVLESIVDDAACGDSTYFDFCQEFGYDSDSRAHLETYLKCQELGRKLRSLITGKTLHELQQCER